MNDAKEEIRARLAVEDVVGQYIELKRAGRNLKGRSPWGVDKTPSFMVSPEKGIWHDFSANKGGDIFSFVMEVEGVTFREALEKLAVQAGVDLSKYSRVGDKTITKRKARAREALELACRYYQLCLAKNKKVCEYVFYKRNLDRKTVKEFRIGYAPSVAKALVAVLEKEGFSKQELEDAGLLNQYGGDLFRGRMTVPFMDTVGNVIGFTARVIGDGEPKYLNTPETLLFNKSRFIFGLTQAKESIRKNGFCVIVEGNMDVISSHQAGVKEAVATSGTAMTNEHLKILSKLTSDIRLAYDKDAAGIEATERAIMMAGDLGINLTVVRDYGGAKDPDELIQKDPELWQKAVTKCVPAVDFLLEKYEEQLDLSTGAGKKKYTDVALSLLKYVTDVVERTHYEQKVARKVGVSLKDLREKKLKLPERGKKRLRPVKVDNKSDRLEVLEKYLLAVLIYGDVKKVVVEDLVVPEDKAKLEELRLIFQVKYGRFSKVNLESEAQKMIKERKREMTAQKIQVLNERLKEFEDDEQKTTEILQEIMELQRG